MRRRPADLQGQLGDLYRRAIAAAGALPDLHLIVHALMPAGALAGAGRLDDAERALAALPSDAARDFMRTSIEVAVAHAELDELSPFERSVVESGLTEIAYSILHALKIEGNGDELLAEVLGFVAGDEAGLQRLRILSEYAPQLAALCERSRAPPRWRGSSSGSSSSTSAFSMPPR